MTAFDFSISGQHYLFDVQSFAHTILAAGGDSYSYALRDRTTQGVLYSSRTRRDFHSIYAGAMRYIWTPKISIEGKWLEALGYHIGDHIKVEYDEQGIHIRPLTAMEQKSLEQTQATKKLENKIVELTKIKTMIEAETAALSMVAERKADYPATSEIQPSSI